MSEPYSSLVDTVELNGLRVLIVDDNKDVGDATEMMLSIFGAAARVVYSAERILDDVREFAPAVVLLDIEMPGTDGYQACRVLRAQYGKALRIVAVTAQSPHDQRVEGADDGFDAWLTKPVHFELLIDVGLNCRRRAR